MNEQWVCTKCKKALRSLTSKKTGNIYRWCENCGENPVDEIFQLREEVYYYLRQSTKEKYE